MAVTIEKLDEAIMEARRFIKKAADARKSLNDNKYASFGCKETGAVRRASMDLTRSLVDIRK